MERQNLTMRMLMGRLARLTNAFSKKVENLEAAVALHFMHLTSAAFIRPFGLPRRWNRALPITSGPSRDRGALGRE